MWQGDGADGGVVWLYAVMRWRWGVERSKGADVGVVRFLEWRCRWVGMGFRIRIGKAIQLFLRLTRILPLDAERSRLRKAWMGGLQ